MLHKPAGYLSATSDPQHPTVMELIDHPLRDELHLVRLLDRQLLGEAFRRLKRKAAPGIDGVTHSEYAENLEENLLALESRLKGGNYRAQPVKRRFREKGRCRGLSEGTA